MVFSVSVIGLFVRDEMIQAGSDSEESAPPKLALSDNSAAAGPETVTTLVSTTSTIPISEEVFCSGVTEEMCRDAADRFATTFANQTGTDYECAASSFFSVLRFIPDPDVTPESAFAFVQLACAP